MKNFKRVVLALGLVGTFAAPIWVSAQDNTAAPADGRRTGEEGAPGKERCYECEALQAERNQKAYDGQGQGHNQDPKNTNAGSGQ